jgi:hypothetical protein
MNQYTYKTSQIVPVNAIEIIFFKINFFFQLSRYNNIKNEFLK